MSAFLRLSLLFFCLSPVTIFAAPVAPAPTPAPATKPVAPHIATPVSLDVVTFVVHTDGQNHKLVVTTGAPLLRVDAENDGFAILYNPETDHYTGLEKGNYTWWEFSWPEVRSAVESSKRYETHLQELNLDGISVSSGSSSTAPATNAPSEQAPALVPDDSSGYVWKQTTDKKRISGVDCVRWVGETLSGPSIEAWCVTTPMPKLQAAFDRLRAINEPIALVPVRSLVPPLVFPVFGALAKGGVTPIVIIWGGDQDKSRFSFIETKTIDYKPDLFVVPKLYVKTTLVTMDGMIDQSK